MSAGVAPGDIIIAIGSPGTTRNSTKTMSATPNSVAAAMIRRLKMETASIGYEFQAASGGGAAPAISPLVGEMPDRAEGVERNTQNSRRATPSVSFADISPTRGRS